MLSTLIYKNNIDPIHIFDEAELELTLRRENIHLPMRIREKKLYLETLKKVQHRYKTKMFLIKWLLICFFSDNFGKTSTQNRDNMKHLFRWAFFVIVNILYSLFENLKSWNFFIFFGKKIFSLSEECLPNDNVGNTGNDECQPKLILGINASCRWGVPWYTLWWSCLLVFFIVRCCCCAIVMVMFAVVIFGAVAILFIQLWQLFVLVKKFSLEIFFSRWLTFSISIRFNSSDRCPVQNVCWFITIVP